MRPVEPVRPVEANPAPGTRSPGEAGCDTGVCVTCSDAAVPGTVLRLLDDDLAIVDTGADAGTEEISVALVSVTIGDVVYVHAGEAIAVRRGVPAPDTARDPHGPCEDSAVRRDPPDRRGPDGPAAARAPSGRPDSRDSGGTRDGEERR